MRLVWVLVLSATIAVPAAAQTDYRIRAPEVSVPEGVGVGQYERSIRPFGNWTLICDENLEQREMVCNITQTVENGAGALIFSWSLAATEDGSPYMILRTAPDADEDGVIALGFAGRAQPVNVEIDGCNAAVCLGMVPVGPIMREQIAGNADATISYRTRDGGTVSVQATLEGLSLALDALE